MCCDIILLILGVIILIKGQVLLTRTKEVRGVPARIIGLLLMLPLPLAFIAGLLLGGFYVAQGKPIRQSELQGVGTVLGFAIVALCVLSAIVVASVYAQPIRKPGLPTADMLDPPDDYREHFPGTEGRRPTSRFGTDGPQGEPPPPLPPEDRIQG